MQCDHTTNKGGNGGVVEFNLNREMPYDMINEGYRTIKYKGYLVFGLSICKLKHL